jgi:putative transposase
MESEKANYPVRRMAQLLGVSRSGYYAWRRRSGKATARAEGRRSLDADVLRVHTESGGVYGAPRIHAQLARGGVAVDRKTVAASMRRLGIEGISPRRFRPVAGLGGVRTHSIPDLVERGWDTGRLNAVWISDITYLRTNEGWVYLCAVRDACSRRVVGWAMDRTQTTALVEKALRMAHVLRGELPRDVVFHADRGTQYTSAQLADACKALGLRQSVGRTGVCWDNAMQESFWSTLKAEFYNRRSWPTRSQAIQETGRWIEQFYNRTRLHSALGYHTPVEFEQTHTAINQQTAQAA